MPVLAGVEDAPGVVDADRGGVVESRGVVLKWSSRNSLCSMLGGLNPPPPLVSPERRLRPADHIGNEEVALPGLEVVYPDEPEGALAWILGLLPAFEADTLRRIVR